MKYRKSRFQQAKSTGVVPRRNCELPRSQFSLICYNRPALFTLTQHQNFGLVPYRKWFPQLVLLAQSDLQDWLRTWLILIDIHQRSQTSYTTPCNGVISHGAQFGGLRVFANHTCKNKRKTNAFTILKCPVAFSACLASHSDSGSCSNIRT